MLNIGWLVAAVVVAVLLSMWVTFTLTRLDRLHARVDAAQAALDAQLVRRAATLQRVAESPDSGVPQRARAGYQSLALDALSVRGSGERQAVENAVGRAIGELLADCPLPPATAEELREVAARVQVARRFYNDAARDTRTLRARRMPRLFRLAGRREMPQFFDIDDTIPDGAGMPALTMTEPAATEPAATEPDPAEDFS